MPAVYPFRALRFHPEVVGDLSGIFCPPYDLISPEQQQGYLQRHPQNVVRLELPPALPGDDVEAPYRRAGELLRTWLATGVLRRDRRPAFYRYEIGYTLEGERRAMEGMLALASIDSPRGSGKILPHEETFPKAKEDRLRLLRACRANTSPIFALYSDPEHEVARALRKAGQLVFEAQGEGGTVHRLERVTEPEALRTVARLLRPRTVLIADGHHRFETARNYRDERGATEHRRRPWERVLIYFVDMDQPGMTILPTHRAVRAIPSWDAAGWWERLRSDEVFRLAEGPASAPDLAREIARRPRTAFGVITRGRPPAILELVRPEVLDAMLAGRPEAWRRLDTVALQHLVLQKHLGITPDPATEQRHLLYCKDAGEAARLVERGEAQIAFLLRPTPAEAVRAVAEAGEKMPRKSTYFYPKPLTGVVLNLLENP